MNELKLKLKYNLCEQSQGNTPVIIVAAGSSTRMNGKDKQLANICGIPVLAKTMLAFENSSIISNIILVVKAENIFEVQMMTEKYMIKKVTDIICGGNTRQQSVLKGLSRVDKDAHNVLIHDGARPLVTQNIINNVAEALKNNVAVTCGVKAKDTIKQIDKNGKVIKTIDRNSLIYVQTPQGVRVEEYKKATEKLIDIDKYTDDTSIMEAAGYPVITVEGSYSNIKITTPEDIKIAESILSGEEE